MSHVTPSTSRSAIGTMPASTLSCLSQNLPVVFVVDDDAAVRAALTLLVHSAGWQPETCACAEDFLARPRPLAPSCLVLDVSLPDLNGLDLQERMAAEGIEMPIVFITGYGDIPLAVRAMKGGAIDFLTKPFRDDVLLSAIAHALQRSCAAHDREDETRTLRERHASLSHREREVMSLVVAGLLNKQVGAELGISEITVKAHRGRVMQKMMARTLPDLVNMAARLKATWQHGQACGAIHPAAWTRVASEGMQQSPKVVGDFRQPRVSAEAAIVTPGRRVHVTPASVRNGSIITASPL